jgi:hypothetical protein
MWKLGLLGVWCAAVSLTAVYVGFEWTQAPELASAQYPLLTEHEVVKSDLVTVPIIRAQKVNGYVVAEVTLTANDEAWRATTSPSTELTDELIATLMSTPVLTDPDFVADALRFDLVTRMNNRAGTTAYYKTLLTRLDYLTVADLERMRSPGGNVMKSKPIIDKSSLDVVPLPEANDG